MSTRSLAKFFSCKDLISIFDHLAVSILIHQGSTIRITISFKHKKLNHSKVTLTTVGWGLRLPFSLL